LVGDKESCKWLIGLERAQSATDAEQEVLVVGDRESDVYALFAAPRRAGTELLIRLAHNRRICDDDYAYVRDAIAAAPVAGVYEVEIPRQGSRPKRVARLDVRSARVTLRAPQNRRDELPDSIPVSLVWAVEQDAPDGVTGLDWTLLTTNEVVDYECAVDMIRCYTARWVIEEFHRVLKSGCRVEQMQFETADRLAPAIGILSVVAWRVLSLTKQAHADPEMDVSEVASAEEASVLSQWLRAQGERTHSITTARAFHVAVARLGGFLGRKSDGMPGTKTTWQGLRSLEMLVLGYRLAAQNKM
jgi:Transposase Tn5 dimerisation domain.